MHERTECLALFIFPFHPILDSHVQRGKKVKRKKYISERKWRTTENEGNCENGAFAHGTLGKHNISTSYAPEYIIGGNNGDGENKA